MFIKVYTWCDETSKRTKQIQEHIKHRLPPQTQTNKLQNTLIQNITYKISNVPLHIYWAFVTQITDVKITNSLANVCALYVH